MNTVVHACIDGRADTAAVVDWAVWSARRLDAPLDFLHVLERPAQQHAALADYSGAIGLGAQDSLLQQLSEVDAQPRPARAGGGPPAAGAGARTRRRRRPRRRSRRPAAPRRAGRHGARDSKPARGCSCSASITVAARQRRGCTSTIMSSASCAASRRPVLVVAGRARLRAAAALRDRLRRQRDRAPDGADGRRQPAARRPAGAAGDGRRRHAVGAPSSRRGARGR